MGAARTYLDHNATSPLRPEAREAMLAALDVVGNPSSVHAEGRRARAIVEDAREAVAALVGAKAEEVVFTSGATEANNWVLGNGWSHVTVAVHEHDSVLAPARAQEAALTLLPCDERGVAVVSAMASADGGAKKGGLVSMHLANAETGVIQPLPQVVAARTDGVLVHSDAVQAAGRVPVDFRALDLDFMSVSAHKFGGPKGIGALVIRDGIELSPHIRGGGQERRRRSGTENVAAIAGFGAAAKAASAGLVDATRLARLRDDLEADIRQISPQVVVIGADSPRLPNTSCLALPGAEAMALLIKLDLKGIAVSAGSACSSGKVGSSHVLAAMGVEPDIARGAIRISLGWNTREEDIESFVTAWDEIQRSRAKQSLGNIANGARKAEPVGATAKAGA